MQHLKNKASGVLRPIERFLKFDTSYLVKGSIWTTLSFLVSFLASLVTMVAFGNLLPRESYGTYNYLLALGASLSFLTLSGAGPAIMRSVARGYENLVPIALRLQLKWNLIAIATIGATAIYYGLNGNMLFAFSLLMLAFAYPLTEAFHLYAQVLTGRKRFDIMSKITIAINLIGAIITVGALLLTDDILILIAIYALMSLLPSIIAYKFVTRNLDKTTPDSEQIGELKRTSFHFTAAGLIGVIASYIDKIILFQVAGPAALAVYGFAIAGPDRLKSLIKNWLSIALPGLAQKSLSQIRLILYRRLGLSLLIGLSLAAAYWLVAPLLFKIFLPRYMDAIFYSQVLALGLIVVPPIIYIGSIFSAQNMLRATYALNFGSQIMRIILFIIFGWLWQIWGLIAASILSSLINTIYGIIIWEMEMRRLIKANE